MHFLHPFRTCWAQIYDKYVGGFFPFLALLARLLAQSLFVRVLLDIAIRAFGISSPVVYVYGICCCCCCSLFFNISESRAMVELKLPPPMWVWILWLLLLLWFIFLSRLYDFPILNFFDYFIVYFFFISGSFTTFVCVFVLSIYRILFLLDIVRSLYCVFSWDVFTIIVHL